VSSPILTAAAGSSFGEEVRRMGGIVLAVGDGTSKTT
jgi:hypothetical protein